MTDDRVVTAKLPAQLANRLDEASQRLDRSRSWVIREALIQWLSEEERRHILTLEAMEDVASGRTVSQEEVRAWAMDRKQQRVSA